METYEIYYFTFSSDKRHTYQNAYIVIIAVDYNDAIRAFKEKNYTQCSNCYNEEHWKKIEKNYKDKQPAEVIWTESSLGHKPEGYEDLFVFVQDTKQIIRIAEGTGDNLLQEDVENGYVDYIYYEQYKLDTDIESVDGGQILLKEAVRDKYKCLADCLQDVLDMAYGNAICKCRIIM